LSVVSSMQQTQLEHIPARPPLVWAALIWLGSAVWFQALLVGALALLPRTLDLADFFTIDEPYHWIGRVQRFSEALREGNWAATNQTGHPGVTTMWLGALGQWLGEQRGVYDPGWAGGGAEYLAALRLPLAVVNSLAVVLGFLLLRRLLRPSVAFLGALLWATSPFLIAHSRLLHLDALLTSFMTLSVLCLLVALNDKGRPTTDERQRTKDGGRRTEDEGSRTENPEPRTQNPEPRTDEPRAAVTEEPPYITPSPLHPFTLSPAYLLVIASGIFAGLALLTKAPSLILLPFIGLILILDFGFWILDNRSRRLAFQHLRSKIQNSLLVYLLWLGVAALVVFAGWPAMWVDPGGAIGGILDEVRRNGGEPHHSGNYFLGQPVADPGPLFYPAVVLWRTAPWTLIGLLLLPLALRRGTKDEGRTTDGRPRTTNHGPRILIPLLCFALVFVVILSQEPKKFDRYLLPIWPALEIPAAAGLLSILDFRFRILDWRGLQSKIQNLKSKIVLAVALGVFAGANVALYHPYYLSYFNPLLGDGAVAQRVMPVGWGEGLEEVGAWLREQPDLKRGPVLSWIPPTLAPFVPATTLVLDLREQQLAKASSYAVLYSRSVQRKESAVAEAYVRQTPPLYTVERHGIEFASVHQLPRPFDTPVDAVFGDGLHLRGFSQELLGSTLVITPSWNIQASQPGNVFCFVHVLDANNTRVAQVDAPLDQGMFATWQAGRQFDSPFPVPLPADLAPGEYRVVIGLYRPETGRRLPLTQGQALPEAVNGPEVLELTTLQQP
jgi:4-amino-4-deoxy-L-arabinose transferase-like glycosyltransferase